MVILYFVFYKNLEGLEIKTKLRVSVWLEEHGGYLMPCEFMEVANDNNFYRIKVKALDPAGFMSTEYLEKKFLFGHPGKIIGYGILKEVEIIEDSQ